MASASVLIDDSGVSGVLTFQSEKQATVDMVFDFGRASTMIDYDEYSMAAPIKSIGDGTGS